MSPSPVGSGGAPRGAGHRASDAPVTARFRRAAPQLLRGTEKAYGVPGAAKNTGDDACLLFENRIGEWRECFSLSYAFAANGITLSGVVRAGESAVAVATFGT
jgi:hypothetical protein